jgi:RHS repeat-associated protein
MRESITIFRLAFPLPLRDWSSCPSSFVTLAAPNPLASYAYTLDHKVSSIVFSNGTKTVKTYDNVGRLDKVLHMNPGGTALWSETSRYDHRDRRTARIHHDGKADLFSYDPAGQVTAAAYGQSALILPQDLKADTAQPPAVTRWDQTFAYDPAGNRSQFTEAPASNAEPDAIRQWNYQANAANQYTAVKETTSTEASTTEPRYDPNGNLLTDDRNTYTWDADIHLLSVTTKPSEGRAPGSGQLETLNQKPVTSEFRYDPLHRRVARLEPDGTLTHFIHDGWNVIAEYATPPNRKSQIVNHKLPSARHIWGHDISGKPQGAGGIGGLLTSTHNIATTTNDEPGTKNLSFFFNYDSNGNVVVLTDLKGQESGRYAYDAFGKTLLATGAMAQQNRYRFSTKPVEFASGLCFYGYRYYSPELGRWLSRDPITEVGGVNLYGMVGNSPSNYNDTLGLSWPWVQRILRRCETSTGGGYVDRNCVLTGSEEQPTGEPGENETNIKKCHFLCSGGHYRDMVPPPDEVVTFTVCQTCACEW